MPFSSFRASLFGVFSVAVGDLQNHDVAAAVVVLDHNYEP